MKKNIQIRNWPRSRNLKLKKQLYTLVEVHLAWGQELD